MVINGNKNPRWGGRGKDSCRLTLMLLYSVGRIDIFYYNFPLFKILSSPLSPTSSTIGRVIQAFVGVGEEFFATVHKVLEGAARSTNVA